MATSKIFYRISKNWELILLYQNNVIWNIKKLGKSSVTHTSWRTNHGKIKIYKTLIKLKFTRINCCKISTGSQFAKLNPHEMLKKWLTKINPCKNFSP